MSFELNNDEQILADRSINLFRGLEAVGGRLIITNQRLLFQPHAFNIQKQNLEIPLNQIKEVRPRNTMGIVPNGILVTLDTGQEYKLVVWKRKALMGLIDKSK